VAPTDAVPSSRDMHSDWLNRLQAGVDLRRPPLNSERGEDGARRAGRVGISEDDHETVADRLVDVAAVPDDFVEESTEVSLHQPVHLIEVHLGAELGVTSDIRDTTETSASASSNDGALVTLDEVLDRLGTKLSEFVLMLSRTWIRAGCGEPARRTVRPPHARGVLDATAA